MDIAEIQEKLKVWFPPEAHKERELRGKGKWFYIPWQLILERIDSVCPNAEIRYSPPVYLGEYCTITCTITIQGISRDGVGDAAISEISKQGNNMARGSPIERARTDALRQAAEAWGVGRYLDEQADDKTRAAFIRYMQKAGDGRAADWHHRNEGNLPPTRPVTKAHKPFGQPTQPTQPKTVKGTISKEEWEAKKYGQSQGASAT